MTGITRISELAIQYWVDGSPRLLDRAPLKAVQTPARPLESAIRDAISPRLKHPRTWTGVAAIIRKASGRRAGRMMWFSILLICHTPIINRKSHPKSKDHEGKCICEAMKRCFRFFPCFCAGLSCLIGQASDLLSVEG